MFELLIDAGYDGYGEDGHGASITEIKWESDPEKAWKNGDPKVCIWGLLLTQGIWIQRLKKSCFRHQTHWLWLP
jgi:hypothetical protein